ncbi:MAG: ROK family protein [Simkaniaceae bacterium]|nr:ROK family protein [Simkaniaceae bacterium]
MQIARVAKEKIILGIDIGGTKTTICVGNREGAIFLSERIPTDPEGGCERTLTRIAEVGSALCKRKAIPSRDIEAIGLACPGPLNTVTGKLLTPPNLTGWKNLPIVRKVETLFNKPVFFNNDANAGALAMHRFGRYGKENLIYLTASTGMGGGLITGGRLVQGFTDTAAEVGHFVLVPGGRACSCGQRGCFEAYCGGKAFAKYVVKELKRSGKKSKIPTLAEKNSGKVDMAVIFMAIKERDPFALTVWREFIDRLAQGIGTILMIVNPEIVVLGTLATHAGPLLLDPLRKKLAPYCWKEPQKARIVAVRKRFRLSEKSALALAAYGLERDAK